MDAVTPGCRIRKCGRASVALDGLCSLHMQKIRGGLCGADGCADERGAGGYYCKAHNAKGDEPDKTVVDGKGVKGSLKKMKLPLDLIPPLFTKMVALVLMFGARKYVKNNWLRGMSWHECLTGARRHIDKFAEGVEYDDESKLPHLAHAACMLMFLIWFAYGPKKAEYRKLDDRTWAHGQDEWDSEVDRINSLDFSNIKVTT